METIKCKRCRRKLTNKESIRRGYGKICWKYLQTHIDEFLNEEED
jgi:hypothetical protein